MQTIDEAKADCRDVGEGIEKMVTEGDGTPFQPGDSAALQGATALPRGIMKTMVLLIAAALAAPLAAMDFGPVVPVPVPLSSLKIDMTNILKVPVGGMLLGIPPGFASAYTNAAASTDVQFLIPPEWSKGAKCDLLRVGSIMVERDTCKIAAAMSGCVYPTVQEGAFAITNHVHTAVFEASKQKGMLYPLRMEKDGTHIMGYEWTSGDVTYVLDIRIAVNKRRQMAVSAMFHIKGDGLHAKLAP